MTLKPCPFCGGEPVVNGPQFYKCRNGCTTDIPQPAWNTRPGERAAAERMREALITLAIEQDWKDSHITAIAALDIDRVLEAKP